MVMNCSDIVIISLNTRTSRETQFVLQWFYLMVNPRPPTQGHYMDDNNVPKPIMENLSNKSL